jgi:hypothetical protein
MKVEGSFWPYLRMEARAAARSYLLPLLAIAGTLALGWFAVAEIVPRLVGQAGGFPVPPDAPPEATQMLERLELFGPFLFFLGIVGWLAPLLVFRSAMSEEARRRFGSLRALPLSRWNVVLAPYALALAVAAGVSGLVAVLTYASAGTPIARSFATNVANGMFLALLLGPFLSPGRRLPWFPVAIALWLAGIKLALGPGRSEWPVIVNALWLVYLAVDVALWKSGRPWFKAGDR